MVRIVGDRMLSKYWHFYILNLKTLHKNKKFPVLVPWHLLSIDQVRFLAGNQLNELKCHRHVCWGWRWCPKKNIAIFTNKQNSKSCPQDQYKNLTCNMRHVKCDMWEHDKQSLLRIPGSQLFFHKMYIKNIFFDHCNNIQRFCGPYEEPQGSWNVPGRLPKSTSKTQCSTVHTGVCWRAAQQAWRYWCLIEER